VSGEWFETFMVEGQTLPRPVRGGAVGEGGPFRLRFEAAIFLGVLLRR